MHNLKEQVARAVDRAVTRSHRDSASSSRIAVAGALPAGPGSDHDLAAASAGTTADSDVNIPTAAIEGLAGTNTEAATVTHVSEPGTDKQTPTVPHRRDTSADDNGACDTAGACTRRRNEDAPTASG